MIGLTTGLPSLRATTSARDEDRPPAESDIPFDISNMQI
jgi:hypothetical protein